ncbi:MAG TPA: SDR family oxidoreductase [Rectinemataceae bacterium]|nr:SDR family oxidoreductase [Rectinemataceae bacterium]
MEEKKTIVVTGASSGIGNAIATYLAKRGENVIGTCRNPASRTGKADEFFDMIALDITRDDSVKTAFSKIFEGKKTVDTLVCCAGMGIAGSVEETSIEEAHLQMDTNYCGTLRTIKAVLPKFREAGRGQIIVMSSLAGVAGIPFQSFYSSSKFALEGLVEALRLEVAPFGIQVCLVEPGDFRTGFTDARVKVAAYLAGGEASPYSKGFEATVGQMEHDERAGADPIVIAKLIEKLLGKRNLSVRYGVGSIFQRLGVKIKNFMPSRLFEAGLKSTYHL